MLLLSGGQSVTFLVSKPKCQSQECDIFGFDIGFETKMSFSGHDVMMVYITMAVVVPHAMMIIILVVVIWWHWWARSKKKQSGSLPQDFPASRPQGSSNATLATNIVF